jgi:hypothetical protein
MKRFGLMLAALVVSACSSTPPVLAPGVLVLPGSGRSFDQFRGDEQECRSYSQAQTSTSGEQDTAGSMQQRYDRAFVQCMYSKGHKVPVSGRYSGHIEASPSAARTAPPPPPGQPPAGTPPDFRPK